MDPEEISTEPEHLKQIRTFEGDVADAINKQKESIVSIQKAELDRRMNGVGEEEQGGKRALIMALLTLVLVALGGAGSYYAYTTYVAKTAPPLVATPANQFISGTTSDLDASTLSRQSLINAVTEFRNKERQSLAVEQLVLRRGTAPGSPLLSTADFLTRLNSHAPQPLVRAFNDLFMIGGLGGMPSHLFIIMKLNSFGNAFSGMLEWEPRLAADLLPLFVTEGVAESIPTNTIWTDTTTQNRDARILKDPNGKTTLSYAFFDNQWLIITDNESTLLTLIERLESQKLER